MSRINLRGVIVPSEYDATWAAAYIDKGIIMPESRFRALLNDAAKSEPLTVYVNSPGGSVFSAGEMVNAVREWKAETKQPVNVVLGALTASAASAFAIMVADKISAHANAKMMFHGAWTISLGGSEMHQDTAELLDKINGDIKARLVSKYGMAPELVSEWFAEGREGWLSAQELVDSKLASEIISDPSDVIEFPADALGEIETRGLGIAALLNSNTESEEAQDDDGQADADDQSGSGDGGEVGDGDEQDAPESGDVDEPGATDGEGADTGADQNETADTGGAEAIAEAFAAGEIAGIERGHADFEETVTSLRAKLNAEQETARKLQSERDQLRAINATMRESLQKANDHVARLLNGGMKFSASIETWEQALSECGGDYEEARRKYPGAYRAKREQDKANRK